MSRSPMTRGFCLLAFFFAFTALPAEETSKAKLPEMKDISFAADISYKTGDGLSEYEKERCKLDLYLPTSVKGFPVIVWFHGGGITGGNKDGGDTVKVVSSWVQKGIAVASVNYRLSPKVKFPAYLEDGAAAVAWVQKNIASHGGDPKRVFIGGHSAGAYLSMMLGLDTKFLTAAGVNPASVAGLIPVSGQTMTHFTVRVERGLPKDDVIADEAAPVHFVRKDAPPMLLLMGDKDWPARLEENQYFAALLKVKKHQHTTLIVVPDRTHGSIFGKLQDESDPGRKAVLEFVADPTAFGKTTADSASKSSPMQAADESDYPRATADWLASVITVRDGSFTVAGKTPGEVFEARIPFTGPTEIQVNGDSFIADQAGMYPLIVHTRIDSFGFSMYTPFYEFLDKALAPDGLPSYAAHPKESAMSTQGFRAVAERLHVHFTKVTGSLPERYRIQDELTYPSEHYVWKAGKSFVVLTAYNANDNDGLSLRVTTDEREIQELRNGKPTTQDVFDGWVAPMESKSAKMSQGSRK